MTSEVKRDPLKDPLLTPENSVLVVIDYQPSQLQVVNSIDHDLLTRNIVSVARLAKAYGLPIVLSTVNVAHGQPPTLPELMEVLSDSVEIDRTQINAWEDIEFRQAVQATGRKKLIMTALSGPVRPRPVHAHHTAHLVELEPRRGWLQPRPRGRPAPHRPSPRPSAYPGIVNDRSST